MIEGVWTQFTHYRGTRFFLFPKARKPTYRIASKFTYMQTFETPKPVVLDAKWTTAELKMTSVMVPKSWCRIMEVPK